MNDIKYGFADQLQRGAGADHPGCGRVKEKDFFTSGHYNRFGGPLHQRAVSSLALLKGHLHFPAFGNIGDDSAMGDEFVLGISHLKTTDSNPSEFATRPYDAILDIDACHITCERLEG